VEGHGALLDLALGRPEAAHSRLLRAHPAAVLTHDLPILALVGVAVARLAAATGRPAHAARVLGAAARLRGGDDPTSPEVLEVVGPARAALGDEAYDAAYAAGRALDRDEAVAAVHP
jgi:hypothetical protein